MPDWTRHWKGEGNGAWIYKHPDAAHVVVESPRGVFAGARHSRLFGMRSNTPSARQREATMAENRPDYRNTDAHKKAERCAQVVEDWRECAIDVNRDWSELIHDFAWALGLRVQIELEEDADD